MDKIKPGYCSTAELWDVNNEHLRRFTDKVIPFLNVKPGSLCLDIGERNPKMEMIKRRMGIDVNQAIADDFNFSELVDNNYFAIFHPQIRYDIIFCLDVIEHLSNPLWLMREIKINISNTGSIYIMYPTNPRWLWVDGHYNEIPPAHFKRWIVEPLGLRITRQKSFIFVGDWRAVFIGIRPLIRILTGKKSWKSLIRTVYYKWTIYEIKKADL